MYIYHVLISAHVHMMYINLNTTGATGDDSVVLLICGGISRHCGTCLILITITRTERKEEMPFCKSSH